LNKNVRGKENMRYNDQTFYSCRNYNSIP